MMRSAAPPEGAIIRKLYRSSVVSLIAAAIAAMFGMMIDGIIIGKFLGTDSMAAYGLVSPLFNITSAISGVLAAGSQVFCAKHLGAGRVDRARQVFSACILGTVLIAGAMTTILFVFCEPVCIGLGAYGSAADLLPLAKSYLYGISPGILPVLLLFIFNSLMRLDGDPNRVIWAVAAMTVCDIAGDFLNALVFRGGMFGMGVTTAVSYFVALAIMLLHFRKKDIIFRFSFRGLRARDIGGIFRTGTPTAMGSAATMARNLALNHILVIIAGSTAVAALSVRNSLNILFGSVLLGVGMTTTMIAGAVYGEEDRTSAKHLLRVSIKFALVIGILLGLVVIFFAPFLVRLFTNGKPDSLAMARYALRALRLYALWLPLYGINTVFVNYLQGIGRLRLANLISFLDNMGFVVAFSLILAPALSTDAIWIAFPAGEALVILVIALAAAKERGRLPRNTWDLLFLPEDFGAAPENIYEKSLLSIEETVAAAVEIRDFLKKRGACGREIEQIPLCMEEMAGNVIRHGFTKDSREHSVDIRVLKKEDGWILRIRDNCVAFNPLRRAESTEPCDGIRRVLEIARDVQYVNTMQLNNLIIRV